MFVVKREWFSRLLEYPAILRNKVILRLFADTGMRTGELAILKVADVDLKNKKVTITDSKKFKEFTLPLSTKCCEVLRKYMSEMTSANGWLFPSSHNHGSHLSIRQIQEIVKRIAGRAGVPIRFKPRIFRQRLARLWIIRKGALTDLQRILRHKRLSTTSTYVDAIRFQFEEERFQQEYSRIIE